jgi:hypothetical protein
MAVLADEGGGAVFENGDDDGASFVDDDLAAVFDVAFSDVVDADVEDAAVVYGAGAASGGFGHRGIVQVSNEMPPDRRRRDTLPYGRVSA